MLAHVVARCVAAKATIVGADEYDRTDIRAVLNFGHTVGHALENTCGYGALRHGEAVALGMRAALAISRIPWEGPIAASRIARINGEFKLNAPAVERETAELDIVVAGTKDKLIMVEAGAKEISEADAEP